MRYCTFIFSLSCSIASVTSYLSENEAENLQNSDVHLAQIPDFDNSLLLDVAELLDTKVLTTAAYSPWSNEIVERHNAVIENMILKITRDTNCSVENALVWAISAKMPFTITWATALISLHLDEIKIYPQCSLQSHQHSVPQQQVSHLLTI